MGRWDRPALDHLHNHHSLRVIEARGLARRLAVDQAIPPSGIEPHNLIADNLQPDIADLRRLRACHTIVDSGQR